MYDSKLQKQGLILFFTAFGVLMGGAMLLVPSEQLSATHTQNEIEVHFLWLACVTCLWGLAGWRFARVYALHEFYSLLKKKILTSERYTYSFESGEVFYVTAAGNGHYTIEVVDEGGLDRTVYDVTYVSIQGYVHVPIGVLVLERTDGSHETLQPMYDFELKRSNYPREIARFTHAIAPKEKK